MNGRKNIIIIVITLIAVLAIANTMKTNQINQQLRTENKQSQQLLVKLQEQQNEKIIRELTDLLQDVQFIMEVDSNCPPDEMINQINELYNNEKDLDSEIQDDYKKIMNQLEVQNCN